MKKGAKLLICVIVASVCFLTGLFTGRKSVVNHRSLSSNTDSSTVYATEAIDFRIDINTATKVQLMELHGIGELLAERIIDYREKYGPFVTTDDLLNIDGIGTNKLQAITEWIKVGE